MIVFDTSFLVGVYNTRDAHHEIAWAGQLSFAAGEWGRGFLLEYVLWETMSVLLNRIGRPAAAAVGRNLLDATENRFVPCSWLWEGVWQAFATQAGTRLSMTDIAVAMFALGHAEGRVLSFDQEFRKVPGIQLLPATR